jgi:hypothetical protein
VHDLAADDGTISVERGKRYFAPGERVMFDDLCMKIGNDLGNLIAEGQGRYDVAGPPSAGAQADVAANPQPISGNRSAVSADLVGSAGTNGHPELIRRQF